MVIHLLVFNKKSPFFIPDELLGMRFIIFKFEFFHVNNIQNLIIKILLV